MSERRPATRLLAPDMHLEIVWEVLVRVLGGKILLKYQSHWKSTR